MPKLRHEDIRKHPTILAKEKEIREGEWSNVCVRLALFNLGFDHETLLPTRWPLSWKEVAAYLEDAGWTVEKNTRNLDGRARTYAQAYSDGMIPAHGRHMVGTHGWRTAHAGAVISGRLWDWKGTRQKFNVLITAPERKRKRQETRKAEPKRTETKHVETRQQRSLWDQNQTKGTEENPRALDTEAGRILTEKKRPTHRSLWTGSEHCTTYRNFGDRAHWDFSDGSVLSLDRKENSAQALDKRTGQYVTRKIYRT